MLNTLHLPVTLCCVTIRPREPIFFRSTPRCFATAEGPKQLGPDPKVSLIPDPDSSVLNFAAAILNCSNLFTYSADSGVLLTPALLLTATARSSRQLHNCR
jgi:hypothetical protein